jgi:hypothetical protein
MFDFCPAAAKAVLKAFQQEIYAGELPPRRKYKGSSPNGRTAETISVEKKRNSRGGKNRLLTRGQRHGNESFRKATLFIIKHAASFSNKSKKSAEGPWKP